jgi:hypothetical protein
LSRDTTSLIAAIPALANTKKPPGAQGGAFARP